MSETIQLFDLVDRLPASYTALLDTVGHPCLDLADRRQSARDFALAAARSVQGRPLYDAITQRRPYVPLSPPYSDCGDLPQAMLAWLGWAGANREPERAWNQRGQTVGVTPTRYHIGLNLEQFYVRLTPFRVGHRPAAGDVLYWKTRGENDDHVGVVVSVTDTTLTSAEYGGPAGRGGRRGRLFERPVRWDSTRPLESRRPLIGWASLDQFSQGYLFEGVTRPVFVAPVWQAANDILRWAGDAEWCSAWAENVYPDSWLAFMAWCGVETRRREPGPHDVRGYETRATNVATRTVQTELGLKPDGRVGRGTWGAAKTALLRGDAERPQIEWTRGWQQ